MQENCGQPPFDLNPTVEDLRSNGGLQQFSSTTRSRITGLINVRLSLLHN